MATGACCGLASICRARETASRYGAAPSNLIKISVLIVDVAPSGRPSRSAKLLIMRLSRPHKFLLRTLPFVFALFPAASFSQQTNNAANLTNSAAPSASSVTTGGTNINYQTNNAYNNEHGFGPGIFCRTPTIQLGGTYGEGRLDAYDPIQRSGNSNNNYSINAGMIIPFGSSVLRDCKRLVSAIARDREISSQLSMLKTCANLKKEGIVVDPVKFPMLAPCAEENQINTMASNPATAKANSQASTAQQSGRVPLNLKPKTNRLF